MYKFRLTFWEYFQNIIDKRLPFTTRIVLTWFLCHHWCAESAESLFINWQNFPFKLDAHKCNLSVWTHVSIGNCRYNLSQCIFLITRLSFDSKHNTGYQISQKIHNATLDKFFLILRQQTPPMYWQHCNITICWYFCWVWQISESEAKLHNNLMMRQAGLSTNVGFFSSGTQWQSPKELYKSGPLIPWMFKFWYNLTKSAN